MKAQEVLRRYAAGERNFHNANLRGANFKWQDLSGADFSKADIRSGNFCNANLQGANFTKVQAGLQRHWMCLQWILIGLIAAVIGVVQGFVGVFSAFFLDSTNFSSALEQAIGLSD